MKKRKSEKTTKKIKKHKKMKKTKRKMQKMDTKKMMFTQYTSDGMETKISHNPDILDSSIDLEC